jgi:hypothetical protein
LREESRLRVSENRALRRLLGPKRDEVKGGWRKLYNEELHDFYYSTIIFRVIKSRRIGWAGHVVRMGERIGVLMGKPERKIRFGRARCRWEDNIKMDIQEVGCGGIDWIKLAQNRDRWPALVNTVMNFRVP